MSKHLFSLVHLLPLTLLTACDPNADELDREEWLASDDEITSRCAVNGQNHFSAPLVAHPANPSLSASMSNTSPSADYGGKSCGDHYVIQATNVNSFSFHPYLLVSPFWGGPALTASQCPWSVLYYDVAIYYNGAWHQRVSHYDVGAWNGTKCVIGGPIEIYDPNKQAEKVQVAVKAVYLDGTGEHTAKVGASVSRSDFILTAQ
jgi:hypothetical protein